MLKDVAFWNTYKNTSSCTSSVTLKVLSLIRCVNRKGVCVWGVLKYPSTLTVLTAGVSLFSNRMPNQSHLSIRCLRTGVYTWQIMPHKENLVDGSFWTSSPAKLYYVGVFNLIYPLQLVTWHHCSFCPGFSASNTPCSHTPCHGHRPSTCPGRPAASRHRGNHGPVISYQHGVHVSAESGHYCSSKTDGSIAGLPND